MAEPYNQAVYDAHPKDCASLPHFKFFRPGGVCCITCFTNCTGCGAPFYTDLPPTATFPLTFIDGGPVEDDEWLCDCCNRKRLAARGQAENETEEQERG